jgi:rpsU-divergently transcribed protein
MMKIPILKKLNGKINIFKSAAYMKSFCTNQEINILKNKLIKMSLVNVEKYGWTEHSIKLAANELGYSNNLSALLEDGPVDLIYYTMDNWNNKLSNDLETIKNDKSLNLDEKYKKALKLRLSYELPLISSWPQAMKLGMSPQYFKKTVEKLIVMTDTICSIEEDDILQQSTIQNIPASRHTQIVPMFKRYLILKIFLLSEFYMLTDRSYNSNNTWDFIEKLYSINFSIYSAVNKFTMINMGLLSMLKYSLISFLPYDFTQIEEIMRKKDEEEEKERISMTEKNYSDKLNNKI